MEVLILISSLLRVALVAGVYILNIRALLILAWQSKTCVHSLTTGAVLLSCLLYLSSWTPYLTYGLANGQWLLLTARSHCVLQQFVTMETSSVLLALLAIRITYKFFVRIRSKSVTSAFASSLILCVAWLGPQLVFDVINLVRDEPERGSNYRFLDDLLVVPNTVNATRGYRVGFMICMQALSSPVISYYTSQYIFLVLPLAHIVAYCSLRLYLMKRGRCLSPGHDNSGIETGYLQRIIETNSCCRDYKNDTFVNMSLYYNCIWMIFLRPLAILHAMYLQSKDWESAYYMDFGTHLVLAFASVFSPLSPRFGICQPFRRRKSDYKTKNNKPEIFVSEKTANFLEISPKKQIEKEESVC
ncbi:uncharacterized protein LOC111624402 [Centruroides sculpturatus]|uniref:uncharacterized protein LOC111624402 n=1 Tax=Centruroides sculpturatus TaxID=218467 RepID=UPI000C6D02FE|nr:uncharacterized protein LOC111624402 [Centruroides sculpturatus]